MTDFKQGETNSQEGEKIKQLSSVSLYALLYSFEWPAAPILRLLSQWMTEPRVNRFLASNHQRRARDWTGRKYRVLGNRYDPTGELNPAYPHWWHVLNQLYHLKTM